MNTPYRPALLVLPSAVWLAGSLSPQLACAEPTQAAAKPVVAVPAASESPAPPAKRPLSSLPYTPSLEPGFMERSVDPLQRLLSLFVRWLDAEEPGAAGSGAVDRLR